MLSTVGQHYPTALPFDLTELRKVSALARKILSQFKFLWFLYVLVLTVIREILTLLTILLLEIAKPSVSPTKVYRVGQKTGPLCSSEILLRSARFFAEIKVV